MIDAATVRCPKCSGPMWDERPNKKNPKGPDFRCKDKTCLDDKGFKTSLWERDIVKAGGAPQQTNHAPVARPHAPQPHTSGPYIPEIDGGRYDALFATYRLCLNEAVSASKQLPGATPEAIAAMTATLFIAASKVAA